MTHFTEALDAEIADLERQLEAHPIYVKLQDARRLRERYGVSQNTVRTDRESATAPKGRTRPASGTAAEVYDAAIGFLHGKSEPTHIRRLMDHLNERGIDPGGSEPRNTVSSLLSRYKDVFVSHGRVGWTLAETEKAGDGHPAKETSPALLERQVDLLTEPGAQGREAGPGGGT